MGANKDFEKKFKRRFSTLGRIGGKVYDLSLYAKDPVLLVRGWIAGTPKVS